MADSTTTAANPSSASSSAKSRLEALRRLLGQGALSTQDELREKLEKMRFQVTQSTVSRDLRKLGAMKATDPDGRTVYRLPEDGPVPVRTSSIRDLITDIETNGAIIVIHTSPASASLVARHLDHYRPGGILGTVAGEDTIFVAAPGNPVSMRDARAAIAAIEASFD